MALVGVISLVGFSVAGAAAWQGLRAEVDAALQRAVSAGFDDSGAPRLGFGFFGATDVQGAGASSDSSSGASSSSSSSASSSGSSAFSSDSSGLSASASGASDASGLSSSGSSDASALSASDASSTSASSGTSDSSDTSDANSDHAFSSVPVCVLVVDADGAVSMAKSSTGSIYAGIREAVVAETLACGAQSGELSDYGLYYHVGETVSGVKRLAFADASELRNEALAKIAALFVGWLALMAAIVVVSFFLSRYVSRPVERAWADQQRFIADASHELKTPLTVMLADASILQASPDKTVGEQRAWVESIEAEATRMQQLTEDMLTLAQADAGIDAKQVMCDIDFSRVVQGVGLQFEAVAFERGLRLSCEAVDGLHVTGDERKLESLVKTLLENACKYAGHDGHVDMRLCRVKGSAVLAVHNDGDPVPAEDLPHLFDRFYRSDKARTSGAASESASFGLGLSIAKATVQAHGGSISVASGAGAGAGGASGAGKGSALGTSGANGTGKAGASGANGASGASGTTFTVKLPLAKPAKSSK